MSGIPDLLYVADVPVDASASGPLHLYRLLRPYTRYDATLTIAESNISRSASEQRLPGIEYHSYDLAAIERLLSTRFRRWYGSWLHLKAKFVPTALKTVVEESQPEAILTVWHRYSWLTAAALAKRYGLSLHLIVHDDAPNVRRRANDVFQPLFDRDFRRVYQDAESRLCVSPYMEAEYRERYGIGGQVMYPTRGWEAPSYGGPPKKIEEKREEIVVGYSGTIHTPGFKEALQTVADLIRPLGGTLLIRSPVPPQKAVKKEWARSNMDFRSFVPSAEIIPTLRSDADILFLPMAFEGWAAVKNQTNFPAKLTEYTATGLPLLVWGPDNSSGVRWCREHSSLAEVVTDPKKEALRPAVERLFRDAEHRARLGAEALRVGRKYFEAQTAWSTLQEALMSGERNEKAVK